ncbi:MAG: hypothetical protein ACYTEL_25210 [Planctomycetota bacterium]|jgi:hypothetical protein
MKSRYMAVGSICVVFLIGLSGWCLGRVKVPQYEVIEDITQDVGTREGRAAAIAELISIVNDSKRDVQLRELAARKLGELGAVEAKDVVGAVALELEWTDATRGLKSACTLSFWQLRVAEDPNRRSQNNLLIKLLSGRDVPPPHAGIVRWWVEDELASRGVKEALPEIIKSIEGRVSGKRAERRIWLCRTKIEFVSTSSTRLEALKRALEMEDITPDQWLTRCPVQEMGKLGTEQSRAELKEYALDLQNRYYDEKGKRKGPRREPAARHADEFYRTAIRILRKSGMTDEEIKASGLRPDKYFFPAP